MKERTRSRSSLISGVIPRSRMSPPRARRPTVMLASRHGRRTREILCPAADNSGGNALESRFVDLDGPVHFVGFGGEGPSDAGPAMVLIHGLGGSHLNWLEAGPALAAGGRRGPAPGPAGLRRPPPG